MSIRPVKRVIQSKPTMEGAGVHLRRAFGFGNTKDFDPFLLLDDFRNEVPEDYLAGFPWHPHRGIETITYVLAGTVEHGDSMGNRGAIAAGDVQWMTAGSGIIHQEMPKGDKIGRMHGFQLWANLPANLKMTPPRYQEVKTGEIPEVTDDDGTHVFTDIVTRAASAPALTTVTGWAAELVHTTYADLMPLLMPQAILTRLAPKGLTLSFGANGRIVIPTRSRTPTLAGSFVGEGLAIPVRQGMFTSQTLTPKKMAVITTWTREMDDHSIPAIEGLLRQAVIEDTAIALDTILLDNNPATTIRPSFWLVMVMSGSPKTMNRFPARVFLSNWSAIARSGFIRTSRTFTLPTCFSTTLPSSATCGSNANPQTSNRSKPIPRCASRAASASNSGPIVLNSGPTHTAARLLLPLSVLFQDRHNRAG